MRGLALVMMLWPSVLAADVIPVRSGAHDGFTRLVLDLPRRLDWVLSETGDGYRLRLDGGPHSYDTGAVFDRIDRARLAAIGEVDGALALTLACPCRAEAFLSGDRMLVIDLRDGAPEPPEDAVVLDPRADYSRMPATRAGPLPPLADLPTPDAERAARDARVEATRHALARALGEAASNGLLSLSEQPAEPLIEPQAADEPAPPLDQDPVPLEPMLVQPGLAARSGLTSVPETRPVHQAECLPASRFAFAIDPDGSGFGPAIGAARRALFSERDRLNPEAALALARTYIAHGFGAEALAVLDLLGAGERPDMLVQMARVLDGDGDAALTAPVLRAQQACNTPGALWGLLADPDAASEALNENAVLNALNTMPPALRATLGPRVAEALLAAGRPESAAAATAIVTRAGDDPPPEILLTRAEVDITAGALPDAIAGLEDAAHRGGPSGARAVARLIDTQLSAGDAVSRDTALLAAAHEREHRDTDLGAELSEAHARALAASGDYPGALAASGGDAGIVSDTYRAAVATPDEIAFVTFAVPDRPEAEAKLEAEVALRVAERLLEAGFPDPARRFLDAAADTAPDRAARLLRARILLAGGDARAAEGLLLGLTGEAADRLRLESLIRQGEGDAARALALQSGLPWPTRDEAAPAPDLEALSGAGDTPLDADAPLASGRSLLQDSASLRAQIEGLLTRRPVPPAPTDTETGGS